MSKSELDPSDTIEVCSSKPAYANTRPSAANSTFCREGDVGGCNRGPVSVRLHLVLGVHLSRDMRTGSAWSPTTGAPTSLVHSPTCAHSFQSFVTEIGRRSEGKHAVVVGGGWAGFGAAYALLKAGVEVTVLDASKAPGGLSSGWRTPGGRSVEAGIKG